TVLAVPQDEAGIARLLTLGEPLAGLPGTELIVARLVENERELAAALKSLQGAHDKGPAANRIAPFASDEPPQDVVRLATAYDVELVLLDASRDVTGTKLPEEVATLLNQSPADVALTAGSPIDWSEGNGIFVPFGGAEHDWAALELAAWLA